MATPVEPVSTITRIFEPSPTAISMRDSLLEKGAIGISGVQRIVVAPGIPTRLELVSALYVFQPADVCARAVGLKPEERRRTPCRRRERRESFATWQGTSLSIVIIRITHGQ